MLSDGLPQAQLNHGEEMVSAFRLTSVRASNETRFFYCPDI
jgi:hypothetical protein